MKKVFLISLLIVSAVFTGAIVTAPMGFVTDSALVQVVAALAVASVLVVSTYKGRHNFVKNSIVANGPGLFNPYKRITPQAKIISVNDRIGNPGVRNNQGTTVEIYDYVALATNPANQVLEFFTTVNTKKFPFTNIQQNQLQVGEALAIEYMFLTYIIVTDATGEITAFGSISELVKGFNVGQYTMSLDNNRIMKPLTLARQAKQFNPHGNTAENYVFYPDTDLTLPSQINFSANLLIPPVTSPAGAGETLYVGLHWTGSGAILNLKQNV